MDCERLTKSLAEALCRRKSVVDLAADLQNYPELTIFDNKWQCHGSGAVECQYRSLAEWMISQAALVGAEVVVSNLARYVTAESIPYDEIMVLAGVLVEGPIKLSSGVELLSFSQLRPSFLKQLVGESVQKAFQNYQPTAFLRRPVSYPREHLDRTVSSPRSSYGWDFSFRVLQDVRLCMTAIGPCAPVWLSCWIQAHEWVPDLSGGFMQTPELFDIGGYPQELARNWDELPELHRCWVRLSAKEQAHLRVALSRMNSALRRRELVDAAIDLGIAIDALFLSEREPERGELGFTLRVRAARFLGKNETNRREISKLYSDLFGLRSVGVHTGELIGGAETIELLKRGYQLTGEAIRRIIKEGEPDWRNIIFD